MIISHSRVSRSNYFNNYGNVFCCDLIKNRDKNNKINFIKLVRLTLFTSHVRKQRGPTTGPRVAQISHAIFAQVLSITSSGNLFFGERYDFGTKIGISEIDPN